MNSPLIMCLCEIHSPTLTAHHAKTCVINGGKENIISETDDIIRQIRCHVLLHSYTASSSFILLMYGRLLQAAVKNSRSNLRTIIPYSWGPAFKFRSEGQLSCLKFLMIFFSHFKQTLRGSVNQSTRILQLLPSTSFSIYFWQLSHHWELCN
jgi:hypothetical protein